MGYDTPEIRPTQQEIFFAADLARGQQIPLYCQANGRASIGQFCMPLVLPVQTDTVRNLKYVDLGTQVIGMDNNNGVIQIGTTQDPDYGYVLLNAGMRTTYSMLEAGNMLGRKQMWREGNKLYALFLDTAQEQIQVIAVPSLFALLNETDQIPQPLEFGDLIVQLTRQHFVELKHTASEDVPKGEQVIEGMKPNQQ